MQNYEKAIIFAKILQFCEFILTLQSKTKWWYRLTVRTQDSQSCNLGSIPSITTISKTSLKF